MVSPTLWKVAEPVTGWKVQWLSTVACFVVGLVIYLVGRRTVA
jgi:hypothetical protein